MSSSKKKMKYASKQRYMSYDDAATESNPWQFCNYDDPDRYAMGQQSRYLGAFLAAVGVTARVWLVGHSWGGTLCAHWGSQHPGGVRRDEAHRTVRLLCHVEERDRAL